MNKTTVDQAISEAIRQGAKTKHTVVGTKIKAKDLIKKPKGGRPTDFSERLGSTICKRISEGETVTTIAKSLGIALQSIYRWCDKYPAFRERYDRAKKDQATTLINSLVDECADLQNDRALAMRVKSDLIKWVAARQNPIEYGDVKRLELSGEINHRHVHELAPEQRRKIAESWILSQDAGGALIEAEAAPTLPALEHSGVSVRHEVQREIPKRIKPAEPSKRRKATAEADW